MPPSFLFFFNKFSFFLLRYKEPDDEKCLKKINITFLNLFASPVEELNVEEHVFSTVDH